MRLKPGPHGQGDLRQQFQYGPGQASKNRFLAETFGARLGPVFSTEFQDQVVTGAGRVGAAGR